jgi:hypothetical protein
VAPLIPGQPADGPGQTGAGPDGDALAGSPVGHASAAARSYGTEQRPAADWLRLARLARLLSWLTLAWMGIEGGITITTTDQAGAGLHSAIIQAAKPASARE